MEASHDDARADYHGRGAGAFPGGSMATDLEVHGTFLRQLAGTACLYGAKADVERTMELAGREQGGRWR